MPKKSAVKKISKMPMKKKSVKSKKGGFDPATAAIALPLIPHIAPILAPGLTKISSAIGDRVASVINNPIKPWKWVGLGKGIIRSGDTMPSQFPQIPTLPKPSVPHYQSTQFGSGMK